MRDTRKSNNPSQPQLVNDKEVDPLQQAVEHEYAKLFRQTHKASQSTARNILRHVAQRPPPCPMTIPVPHSTLDLESENDNDNRTVSVTISDGTNQRAQKHAINVTMMSTLSSVRELISYVPTMKNIAMRGVLTGIPYLGDKFDDDDQQLINSISGESNKPNKSYIRKKKLDEQSLEILYQSLRSDETWKRYSNDQIIDAIIHHHRDSGPRTKLMTLAHQTELVSNNMDRYQTNIDTCDHVDADITDLIIKPWCSRFCSRCYTYNCLLHKEKSSHLPLPKQLVISHDNHSSPCAATCYKHEREHLKRSLSPSCGSECPSNDLETCPSPSSESIENVKKRRRKSSNRLSLPFNENLHADLIPDSHLPLLDNQKKLPSQPQLLTRIENHMVNQSSQSVEPPQSLLANKWTLTDRSLFRLFYFLCDGDLCLINRLLHDSRTCQDIYEQFIIDAKYFSERISPTNGCAFFIRQPYRRRMLEGATRAFLFHIKKHINNHPNHSSNQKSTTTIKAYYQPCTHEGPCTTANADCYCMQNGTFCEKYCNCPIDCPHRFPGCACKGACLLNNCLCCAEGRECDPDLCHKCGASLFTNPIDDLHPIIKTEADTSTATFSERKTLPPLSRRNTRTKVSEVQPTRQHSLRTSRNNEPSYKEVRHHSRRTNSRTSLNSNPLPPPSMITCANISLQRKLYKQILIAESDVAGYGAFLGSSIAYPGDLIAEYTGEIISEEEADRRGRLYDKQACSYLFNLDTKRCVDARQFGNKIRFANHSSKPNCVPKIKLVNGDYRIGIYAKQVIFQGEELFFEYMYDAHQRQQFVNNERIDELEQDGLTILKRFVDNLILVRPS